MIMKVRCTLTPKKYVKTWMNMSWKRSKWQEVPQNETVISKDSVIEVCKDYSGNNDLKNLTRAESLQWDQWKKSCEDRFVTDYERS